MRYWRLASHHPLQTLCSVADPQEGFLGVFTQPIETVSHSLERERDAGERRGATHASASAERSAVAPWFRRCSLILRKRNQITTPISKVSSRKESSVDWLRKIVKVARAVVPADRAVAQDDSFAFLGGTRRPAYLACEAQITVPILARIDEIGRLNRELKGSGAAHEHELLGKKKFRSAAERLQVAGIEIG